MTPLPCGVLRSALARRWKSTRRPPLGRLAGKRPRLEELEDRTAPTVSQFVDPHPSSGDGFGSTILPLSTGNVVITASFDDAGGTDAGAVYLFNGATGALISTLTGSHTNDRIGSKGNGSNGVVALTNGNYVIESPYWNSDLGAATWENGKGGITGEVSSDNSLVGTTANDFVGRAVIPLTNGNYVVDSPSWSNGSATNAGAVTWGNGASFLTGPVSAANSLVGQTPNDDVGLRVVPLTNGNFVVDSPFWSNGSATRCGARDVGERYGRADRPGFCRE